MSSKRQFQLAALPSALPNNPAFPKLKLLMKSRTDDGNVVDSVQVQSQNAEINEYAGDDVSIKSETAEESDMESDIHSILQPFVSQQPCTTCGNVIAARLQSIEDRQKRQDEGVKRSLERIESLMVDWIGETKRLKVEMQSRDADRIPTLATDAHKCKAYLPVRTFGELVEFEDTMDEKDVVFYMSTVGGITASKMVANLVNSMYSLNLQTMMTWKGIKAEAPDVGFSKHPLENTKIPFLIAGMLQNVTVPL